MNITYRIMEESDIPSVTPFYMEQYNSQGDAWTPETVSRRIRQVLCSMDSYCLIAEMSEEIVGFAIGRFQQYYDLMAYSLVEIVIAPQHQNLGLGTAFMKELEIRVKGEGASMIELMAVNDESHARFYGKLHYYKATNLIPMGKFI